MIPTDRQKYLLGILGIGVLGFRVFKFDILGFSISAIWRYTNFRSDMILQFTFTFRALLLIPYDIGNTPTRTLQTASKIEIKN
jgi:hypothetical protein